MRKCVLAAAVLTVSVSCRRVERGADYQERIGVAVRLPGRICMAMRNSKLMPGAVITLIVPGKTEMNLSPRSAKALIERHDGVSCPGSEGSDSYRLNLVSGEMEVGQPVVALEARVPALGPAHSFRECRLGTGVHLTAWEGARPLEGRRVWHRYFAGNDFTKDVVADERTCTAAESQP